MAQWTTYNQLSEMLHAPKYKEWTTRELTSKNLEDYKRNFVLPDMKSAFEEAENEILMAGGELSTLLNQEIIDIARKRLVERPGLKISVIAGPNLCAKLNDNHFYHPFLELRNEFQDQFKVFFNRLDIESQSKYGYFHFRIIDKGKKVHFESPHDYTMLPERLHFGKADYEIGKILEDNFCSFIDKNSISEDTSLSQFTYYRADKFKTYLAPASADEGTIDIFDSKDELENYLGPELTNLLTNASH